MKKIAALLLSIALLGSLISCAAPQGQAEPTPQATETPVPTPEGEVPRFTAGTYSATADGFHGPVTIEFVFSDQEIESATVTQSDETLGIGTVALETLTQQVVEYQSLALDSVSGATRSSDAFFAIAEDCAAQAGADLAQLKAPIDKAASTETQQLSADVVVVGAGLAGLCAAVSAGENGANVILLEKLAVTGGCAKASLGSYMVCQVSENEGYHITDEPDTLDAAMARWMDFQADSTRQSSYPDQERTEYALIQTMFTIDWLKSFGATFDAAATIEEKGMAMVQVDVATDQTDGKPAAKLMNLLKDTALEQGAQLYTQTPATDLLLEDGAVVGVVAQSPDGPMEIRAGSVILACGGFAENQEMVREMIPELSEVLSTSSVGNTGDGFAMAREAGAAFLEDAWIIPCWPGPANAFYQANHNATVFQDSNSPLDISESSYYRLVVDSSGARFMNEAAHYSVQNITMARLDRGPYWALYSGLEGTALEIAESGLATGTVVKGDTVAEVAQAAGVDPETLQASVDAYNAACAAGIDEAFGKAEKYLSKPVGDGPYYMIQIVPSCSDTLGGVETNLNQQVLREDGSVIEGLYAVGSMSNKYYYNQMYFSGSSLTFASMSGKTAGAHAAGVEDAAALPAA